jgi:hypothetical protein
MGLIYRIENAEGKGPYQGITGMREPLLPMHYSDEHPSPEDDSKLVGNVRNYMRRQDDERLPEERSVWTFIYGDFLFGFDSQDQLRRWVYNDQWMKDLDEAGFHLTVLDVPDDEIIAGYTQAIFKRDSGRQKYRCKLCDFFAIPTE